MAITLERSPLPAITLEAFMGYLKDNVRADDEQSAIDAAPMLGALAKNRTFIREALEKDIEKMFDPDHQSLFYTAHSFILGHANGAVLRANIWPEVGKFSGTYREKHVDRVYSYGLPHDHNFSFLTVGYSGSGYTTDIYEYDYWRTDGVKGESVDMRFLETTTLPEGKLMFFRRGRDVHIQHPPQSISISLNVLLEPKDVGAHDQYVFDVSSRKIADYVTGCDVSRKIGIIRMAALIGSDETCRMIVSAAQDSKAPRLRASAYRALISARPHESEHYLDRMRCDPAASVRDAASGIVREMGGAS